MYLIERKANISAGKHHDLEGKLNDLLKLRSMGDTRGERGWQKEKLRS